MSLFVNKLEFGDSILAGGLLGLLVLPVIIRTEESLKAVDDTFRQASFGLGAVSGKRQVKLYFQSHFQISLPLILSIGRVLRDGSILFTVAAKLPTSIFDQAMALPYHLCDFDQRY
jgi:phosphate transport system permease protein